VTISWRASKLTHWQRLRFSHRWVWRVLSSVIYRRTVRWNRGSACCLVHVGFLFHLLFGLEDGDDMFLRNIGWLLTGYMTLYPTRQNSSTFDQGETRQRGAPQDNDDWNIIFASLRQESGRGCQDGLETMTDGLTGVNRDVTTILVSIVQMQLSIYKLKQSVFPWLQVRGR
jgi:hypothetical protein